MNLFVVSLSKNKGIHAPKCHVCFSLKACWDFGIVETWFILFDDDIIKEIINRNLSITSFYILRP